MEYIKCLFKEEEVAKRVKEVAKEIENDYDNEIIMVCVLKGAMFFYTKLTEEIDKDIIVDFIKVASYNGLDRGDITLDIESTMDVKGKDVVIVEDIVDSGYTLDYLVNYYKSKGASSVKTCALLNKQDRREIPIKPDYLGFEIPDRFIVGYGLDFDEYYRNLHYVGYIENENIDKFKEAFYSTEKIKKIEKIKKHS